MTNGITADITTKTTKETTSYRLEKLAVRLRESTDKLTELRNVFWLSMFDPEAFNAWYGTCYHKHKHLTKQHNHKTP